MDPTVTEWLDLVVRWAHVVTGIAWIGASFYFNWLLNRLIPPEEDDGQVQGELWAIHAGGFFRVQKRTLPPGRVPEPLHWFKWEAYWTWITGFALLVIVYYVGAGAYLIDPGVADIGPGAAIAIGVGVLVVSWFVYDLLWRSPLAGTGWIAAAVSFALLTGVAWGLSQVFSGRGAYIHVGAILGTLMAGNVLRVIMPAQRELVAAAEQGREHDAALTAVAEQRSLHNNYMMLPVLFVMVSNHFPTTYGHAFNWAVLAALLLAGAGVRHYFNVRHRPGGARSVWLLLAGAAAVAALAWFAAPRPAPQDTAAGGAAAPFAEVRAVIARRCVTCHSATPTHEAFETAPKGVKLDTPRQIKALAAKIRSTTVATEAMPLGNLTGMTTGERALLGRWIAQGARTE